MVLGWQALDAKKADKPLEQGRALEQVGARMKRVMGLTFKLRGAERAGEARLRSVPLERRVSPAIRSICQGYIPNKASAGFRVPSHRPCSTQGHGQHEVPRQG